MLALLVAGDRVGTEGVLDLGEEVRRNKRLVAFALMGVVVLSRESCVVQGILRVDRERAGAIYEGGTSRLRRLRATSVGRGSN